MSYVDCWVAAVPTANKDTFRAHAENMAAVFKEYGADTVMQSWGHAVPDGEVTSFPMAVKCGADETVTVGWMVWPSKEARDAVWEKAMADPRLHPGENPAPFDGKRLIFGAFETLVAV